MSTLNPTRRLAANLAALSASRWLPYALFAGLVTMWAYNYVVMKVTLQAATPITHLIIRTTIGSLTLFGVLLARGHGLKPQRLKQTLQVGLTTTFAYGLTVTLALVAGAAGRTSVLVFTMPFWVALLSRWLLAEPFTANARRALIAGFAGLMLIVAPWQLHGVLPMLLAVLAGFLWALGSVLTKKTAQQGQLDSLNFSGWQALIGLAPLPLLLPFADFAAIHWSPAFVLGMVYSGVFSSAVGWLAWLWLLRRLPASTLSFNALVIPVLAVAMAATSLGEWPGSGELLGMLLIGMGIVLIARR
ncbi:DMT family transporter [Vogesella indigofera]|uniref:DMT family transporter n=1 Tax=Vogesella indigofera TaxID=45465 RepID=UPI00234F5548|nr:DMT family transporter [Vogesella indigofera]MDC7697264.1 DMT family transporter [Vogesella indigofera]